MICLHTRCSPTKHPSAISPLYSGDNNAVDEMCFYLEDTAGGRHEMLSRSALVQLGKAEADHRFFLDQNIVIVG